MNIDEFKEKYAAFKDADKILITCDYHEHDPQGEIISIGKQPAKRNIMKNSGKTFICRKCYLKHFNPMNNKDVENRQTEDLINVFCPHPEHIGEPSREMKKRNYYGAIQEPYLQVCGSCSQIGKEITEEQREKISIALKGITRNDEFKKKLSDYMKNNPEGIARGKKNLFENHCTTGMLGKHHSEETKNKVSEIMSGRVYDEKHCENISGGRKKMLEETGGFTIEHRENISKATIRQYQNGFDPNTHHLKGKHNSPKAGIIHFRSSYEKKAYIKLDEDETVKNYFAEKLSVEYYNPEKNINSQYLVDITVEYIDGSKKLIEVKPEKMLEDKIVQSKIVAGKIKASELGYEFEVWTEMDLFGHVYNKKNMNLFIEKIRNGEV
jgi:hypothetical protein